MSPHGHTARRPGGLGALEPRTYQFHVVHAASVPDLLTGRGQTQGLVCVSAFLTALAWSSSKAMRVLVYAVNTGRA